MPFPARRAAAIGSARAIPSSSRAFARWDVVPEDRIGPLPARPGRKLAFLVVTLAAIGGAWAYQDLDAARVAWLWVKLAVAPAGPAKPLAGEKSASAEKAPTAAEARAKDSTPAHGGDLSARLPAAVERQAAPASAIINETPAVQPVPPAQQAAASSAPGATYAPPQPPQTDPLRQRAEAAGLHPEISRALLARLSPVDLRNASTAVETALSQTADGDVLAWPRQRKPEEALFRVHFVAGAAPQCRRYVVTVTKDGWSTTALPMEKCGVQGLAQRRK